MEVFGTALEATQYHSVTITAFPSILLTCIKMENSFASDVAVERELNLLLSSADPEPHVVLRSAPSMRILVMMKQGCKFQRRASAVGPFKEPCEGEQVGIRAERVDNTHTHTPLEMVGWASGKNTFFSPLSFGP